MTTVGERLTQARKERQMTQQQVSEQMHVTRQTISNWETGRNYPDIVSLIDFSDLYSVTLDELLKGDANMMRNLQKQEIERKNARIIFWCTYLTNIICLVLVIALALDSVHFAINDMASFLIAAIVLINFVALVYAEQRYHGYKKGDLREFLIFAVLVVVVIGVVISMLSVSLAFKLGLIVGGLLATVVVFFVRTKKRINN